ncbi:MAG: hypothetical protein WC712_13325 [Candidatus Brocadiia bacterium]
MRCTFGSYVFDGPYTSPDELFTASGLAVVTDDREHAVIDCREFDAGLSEFEFENWNERTDGCFSVWIRDTSVRGIEDRHFIASCLVFLYHLAYLKSVPGRELRSAE